jgi:hypothetical protein
MTNNISKPSFFVKRYIEKTMSVGSFCSGIDAVIECLKGDKGLFSGVDFLELYNDSQIEKLKSILSFPNFTSLTVGDKDYGFEVSKD